MSTYAAILVLPLVSFDQREYTTACNTSLGSFVSYQSRSNQIKLYNREIIITAGPYNVDILD